MALNRASDVTLQIHEENYRNFSHVGDTVFLRNGNLYKALQFIQ